MRNCIVCWKSEIHQQVQKRKWIWKYYILLHFTNRKYTLKVYVLVIYSQNVEKVIL